MPKETQSNGLVYHVFDTKTGRAYIGQTWMSLEDRKKNHLKNGRRGYFVNALRARPSDFVWTVLAEVTTQRDLDVAEDHFIVEFDTLKPNGYNLKRGGVAGRHTEETRSKLSAIQRGKKASPEHRRAISEGLQGHTSWWKGKKLSPEHRAKISASRRARS